MKKPSTILRIAAFLLIIVFSQKTGAGLFYHNLYHTNTNTEAPGDKNLGYSCTCIDDFLMPFEEATIASIQLPLTEQVATNSLLKEDISFCISFSPLLRGPPAYILS